MKYMYLYEISLCVLLLSACATLTAEGNQAIAVTTTPPGAACALSNAEGAWKIAATPGSATVERSFSPLAIRCTHPSAGSGSVTLEPTTRGRAYGNLLMLGIPALVDAATGDGYEYTPAEVDVSLAVMKP